MLRRLLKRLNNFLTKYLDNEQNAGSNTDYSSPHFFENYDPQKTSHVLRHIMVNKLYTQVGIGPSFKSKMDAVTPPSLENTYYKNNLIIKARLLTLTNDNDIIDFNDSTIDCFRLMSSDSDSNHAMYNLLKTYAPTHVVFIYQCTNNRFHINAFGVDDIISETAEFPQSKTLYDIVGLVKGSLMKDRPSAIRKIGTLDLDQYYPTVGNDDYPLVEFDGDFNNTVIDLNFDDSGLLPRDLNNSEE